MLRAGVRVRILKGERKGQEDTIANEENGMYYLGSDPQPHPKDSLQEVPARG